MTTNILLKTDTYQLTHANMRRDQKAGKDIVYMYNRNAPMVLFGLAGRIDFIMNKMIRDHDINELEELAHLNGIKNPPVDVFRRLVREYGGRVSKVLNIEMLPEFTWVPTGTPFCKIQNMVEGFEILTTYWEGFLSKAYFPSAVLTRVYQFIKNGFKNIHNFSYRASRSESDAMLSDLCFLMLYPGTDSFHINSLIKEARYNNLNDSEEFFKYRIYGDIIKDLRPVSIPAANHQTVQSFRKPENAYHDIIKNNSNDVTAMPIDTYGAEYFIYKNLEPVFEYACVNNTNLFLRIDSGNIDEQVQWLLREIVNFKITNALMNINSTPKIGIIVGDSMDFDKVNHVWNVGKKECEQLSKIKKIKIDVDEYLYFGVGSGIINGITRDTLGWVTKLGWSSDSDDTMKTARGKQSLLGDIDLHLDTGDMSYIATDKRNSEQGMSRYVNWNNAVQMSNFEEMHSGILVEHKLIIDPELTARMEKFKQRFVI